LHGAAALSAARASLLLLYELLPLTNTTVFPFGFFGRTEHLSVLGFCTM
jgi:hypothetical protein